MSFLGINITKKLNRRRIIYIGIIGVIAIGIVLSGFIVYLIYIPYNVKQSLKNFTGDYYFHDNYTDLLQDLKELNETFSSQAELFSLNQHYGYPLTVEGHEIWCLRITNESSGLNKPEALYIGCHHGNEIISFEAAFWFGHWLLDNYEKNEYATFLVNNREICSLKFRTCEGIWGRWVC